MTNTYSFGPAAKTTKGITDVQSVAFQVVADNLERPLFGGDLIAVTGDGTGGGGVWRVTAATNATRVAQLIDAGGEGIYLEGVLTVPNDPLQYGPWAGKIVTCGEHVNLLFAVDGAGNAAAFDFGIAKPEALALVATNQNLFCLNYIASDPTSSTVLSLPGSTFNQFVGDILVVEEATTSLVIVHWDGAKWVTRRLPVSGASSLEPVVFAPIEAR